MERFLHDLRYTGRMIRRSPMFAGVVLLSLAVGIGANTALFSLVDAMLLRKLPVEKPDELVFLEWFSGPNQIRVSVNGRLYRDQAGKEMGATSFAYATFEELRKSARTLSDVFAFAPMTANVNVNGNPEMLSAQLVSGNYFPGLRARAVLGRTITDEDDRQANQVAVISYAYWQRRFALDPGVLGQTIALNGMSLAIAGVTPPGFEGTGGFGIPIDISLPISLEAQLRQFSADMRNPRGWWVRIMGRIKPGLSLNQAQTDLAPLFLSTIPAQPVVTPPLDIPKLRVISGSRGLTDGFRDPSQYLLPVGGISLILLLIVCVNIANLLLARAAARRQEIGVRLALGASRYRVIHQLLTETVLLCLAGGALGTVLAYWGKDLATTVLPQDGFAAYDLRLDGRVLAFTLAASVLTGVLFGLVPAVRSTREDVRSRMSDDTRTATAGRTLLREILLVAQVALSLTLLVGAGLLVRTVRNLQNVDVGFKTDNLLLFQLRPSALRYDEARTKNVYERMFERVSAVPGVTQVTFSSYPLVSGIGAYTSTAVEGMEGSPGIRVSIQRVRANFFDTIGIPIRTGRLFTSADSERSAKVGVINETLARRISANLDTLGRRLVFDFGRPELRERIEIVGVVKDVGVRPAREDVMPAVYLPDMQAFVGGRASGIVTFSVRTAGNPLDLAAPIRAAARKVDSNLPVLDLKTQARQIEQGFATERVLAASATFFGGIAMLLACIGLFGLMSYSVERRTREIGIRMALGAQRRQVIALVMRRMFVLACVGILAGIAVSLSLAPVLAKSTLPLLFHVAPDDPSTIGMAVAIMILVACIAAYLPGRRASCVDPTVALRSE